MKFEKPLSKEQKESMENLESFKDFLIGKMTCLPRNILKGKSIEKILNFYQNYLNQEANFESFQNFYKEITKKEIKEKNSNEYQNYLLNKLPYRVQEKYYQYLDEEGRSLEESIERLENVHQTRKENNLQTILGFHCSNVDFSGFEGEAFVDVGKRVEVFQSKELSGLTWYSTNKENLYGNKAKYLLLVEGSRYDEKTKKDTKRPDWVFTKRKLPIIASIPLDNLVIDELNLKFEKHQH